MPRRPEPWAQRHRPLCRRNQVLGNPLHQLRVRHQRRQHRNNPCLDLVSLDRTLLPPGSKTWTLATKCHPLHRRRACCLPLRQRRHLFGSLGNLPNHQARTLLQRRRHPRRLWSTSRAANTDKHLPLLLVRLLRLANLSRQLLRTWGNLWDLHQGLLQPQRTAQLQLCLPSLHLEPSLQGRSLSLPRLKPPARNLWLKSPRLQRLNHRALILELPDLYLAYRRFRMRTVSTFLLLTLQSLLPSDSSQAKATRPSIARPNDLRNRRRTSTQLHQRMLSLRRARFRSRSPHTNPNPRHPRYSTPTEMTSSCLRS